MVEGKYYVVDDCHQDDCHQNEKNVASTCIRDPFFMLERDLRME